MDHPKALKPVSTEAGPNPVLNSVVAGQEGGGNSLSDLLSSTDFLPGDTTSFEATCGSPAAPVDLSTLEGIALDFPLNCNGMDKGKEEEFPVKKDPDEKNPGKKQESYPIGFSARGGNPGYNGFYQAHYPGNMAPGPTGINYFHQGGPGHLRSYDNPSISVSSSSTSNSQQQLSSCRFSKTREQEKSIAERLLQQCLVPVNVSDSASQVGQSWFRCKLCNKTEQVRFSCRHLSVQGAEAADECIVQWCS